MSRETKIAIKKISFSLMLIVVNLIFLKIPVFGVNIRGLNSLFENSSMGDLLDSFTGSGLRNLTMGAFSLSSIITTNIVLSLLTIAIPRLEEVKTNGESGRKFYSKLNLYISLILTLIMSIGVIKAGNSFYKADSIFIKLLSIGQWLIATFIIFTLSEKNNDKGIGQGMSLLIFTNILKTLPDQIIKIFSINVSGENDKYIVLVVILICLIIGIFFSYSYVKVKVLENKRVKSKYNEDTYMLIPFSVTSIMPIIYVNTLMMVPVYIKNFFNINNKFLNKFILMTNPNVWYKDFNYLSIIGILVYCGLLFLLSNYFSILSFPVSKIVDDFKGSNTMIDGVRSGKEMKEFFSKILKRVVFLSFLMLITVIVIPNLILSLLFDGLSISFMGTSLLILINIYAELTREIRALFRHLKKDYYMGDINV